MIRNVTVIPPINELLHEKKGQIAYAKAKRQITFAVAAKLINAFDFATRKVHFLFFFNPKFQASSQLLYLCNSVCVEPVGKPHRLFSHEAA